MKKINRAFAAVLIVLFAAVSVQLAFTTTSEAAVTKRVVKARTGGTQSKKAPPLFAGGAGTAKKPYIVRTAAQLAALARSVNNGNSYAGKYIRLAGDIDLANTAWIPIGFFNKNGTRAFKGNFDGGGATIWNLTTGNRSRTAVGLFGAAEGATISNVSLMYIEVLGESNVGGLVAFMKNTAVKNCSVFGTVEGSSTVGGIVGSALAGVIQDCAFSGTVKSEDGNSVGGLVAMMDQVAVRSCSVEGTIEGDNDVGGLVGSFLAGSIRDSRTNSLTVKGNRNVGGLIGHFIEKGEALNSRFHGQIEGESNVGGLVGRMMGGTLSKSTAEGSVQGRENVGGLVGELGEGTLRNGLSQITVTGVNNVGGVAGLLSGGTIENSSRVGVVKGGEAVGGLVGRRSRGELSGGNSSGSVSGPFETGNVIGLDEKATPPKEKEKKEEK